MAKAVLETHKREHAIPEYKTETVTKLTNLLKTSKTVLLASTKGLPSSQFHEIKKKMRGKAEIFVAKKSLVIRSLEATGASGVKDLKNQIGADIAIFFSEMDAFELSALLTDSQSPTKAKVGDIAPEDITVEPGPTELIPGPAISELSAVGLKVTVEGGKLAIKLPATLAKKGEPIKDNVIGVLAKLNITPMKVGFIPVAAYDKKANKVYVGIRIDKKVAYEQLKDAIGKALGFAINVKYVAKETVGFFLAQASAEADALEAKTSSTTVKEGM
jgi:large subunit ribosomal protein L10